MYCQITESFVEGCSRLRKQTNYKIGAVGNETKQGNICRAGKKNLIYKIFTRIMVYETPMVSYFKRECSNEVRLISLHTSK